MIKKIHQQQSLKSRLFYLLVVLSLFSIHLHLSPNNQTVYGGFGGWWEDVVEGTRKGLENTGDFLKETTETLATATKDVVMFVPNVVTGVAKIEIEKMQDHMLLTTAELTIEVLKLQEQQTIDLQNQKIQEIQERTQRIQKEMKEKVQKKKKELLQYIDDKINEIKGYSQNIKSQKDIIEIQQKVSNIFADVIKATNSLQQDLIINIKASSTKEIQSIEAIKIQMQDKFNEIAQTRAKAQDLIDEIKARENKYISLENINLTSPIKMLEGITINTIVQAIEVFKTMVKKIADVINNVINKVGEIIVVVCNWIKEAIMKIVAVIQKIIETVFKVIAWVWQQIKQGVKWISDKIVAFVKWMSDNLAQRTTINHRRNILKAFFTLKNILKWVSCYLLVWSIIIWLRSVWVLTYHFSYRKKKERDVIVLNEY